MKKTISFFVGIGVFWVMIGGGCAASPMSVAPESGRAVSASSAGVGSSELFSSPPSLSSPPPTAAELGQKLQTLVTGQPVEGGEEEEVLPEPAPTFGMRALDLILTTVDFVRAQSLSYATHLAALPQLDGWYNQQIKNPKSQIVWQEIGTASVEVVGTALVCFLILECMLYPVRRMMAARRPTRVSRKVAVLFSLFVMRAVPIAAFAAIAVSLMNDMGGQKISRYVILNIVYALSVLRIVLAILRGGLAPHVDSLRLLPMSTKQAAYAWRWLSLYAVLLVGGYAIVDVAGALRVPDEAITAVVNILGIVLVAMTVIVIVQKRSLVATKLRGNLSAAHHDEGMSAVLRLWVARRWHLLAIAYLVIGYSIAAFGIQNGMMLMVRGTMGMVVLMLAGFVVMHRVDRFYDAHKARYGGGIHSLLLRYVGASVVWGCVLLGGGMAWGVQVTLIVDSPFGQRVMGSLLSIGGTIIVLSLLYEMVSRMLDRQIRRHTAESAVVDSANGRLRTLLPMLRNTLLAVFVAAVALVILSEAGVNIGPLLAGAGILGVAFGFGSQSLVKDFLTGLFIIMENAVAIGDTVKIGEYFGVVEALNIRTLRLRDMDGAVHIMPFSEVTKLTNYSKDMAYAQIRVGVSYNADLEKAMEVMRTTGIALRQDEEVGSFILDDIEIVGVDDLADYSVILLAKIKTMAGKQWAVRRKMLLRLKQAFDQNDISIPFPTVMHLEA